jgi:hypothetical protein
MTTRATRTLNPLHFEDLEPHRFEDLVRQLIYDFRHWQSIEATGRLGADEGLDIRAFEVADAEPDAAAEEEGDEPEPLAAREQRLWVIQCKREKRIGPRQVRAIVEAALPENGDRVYGLVLAAACDFSRRSRDAFRQVARESGVQEFHLWGKADLEDMLFLPKNDHLLFAYFSISLQVRRRSLRTELRSRLATKRKLIRVLGEVGARACKTVLLRDAAEEHYPYVSLIPDFAERPRWFYRTFMGHLIPDHVAFLVRRCYAYIDDSAEHWDALLDHNEATPRDLEVQFTESLSRRDYSRESRYYSYWFGHIEEKNRAWFEVARYIHYDRILAVDEDGDAYHPGPHLLIAFSPADGPYEPFQTAEVHPVLTFRRALRPTVDNRIRFFPETIPDTPGPEQSEPDTKA